MALLTGTTDYNELADADLVIEAVFENMEVKKEVFKTLSNTVRPETILASNTSYLNIDELASVVESPSVCLVCTFSRPPTSCVCSK